MKSNVNERGSFSSKTSKSANNDAYSRPRRCNEIKEVNEADVNADGMVENTNRKLQGQDADSSNGDTEDASKIQSMSTTQEQHSSPKVGQSFSWLASSPVGLGSPACEQKTQKRKPKSRRVMKYRNEKYLKSWHHCAESPKQKDNASSHSSSTANNSSKCVANDDTGYEASKKGEEGEK